MTWKQHVYEKNWLKKTFLPNLPLTRISQLASPEENPIPSSRTSRAIATRDVPERLISIDPSLPFGKACFKEFENLYLRSRQVALLPLGKFARYRIPIVLISANDDALNTYKEYDADSFLKKPFQPIHLLDVAARYLSPDRGPNESLFVNVSRLPPRCLALCNFAYIRPTKVFV
jgi:hypothetical protein